MTQALALLIDAYRELNARKMFWLTLVISALLIGAYAVVGVNDKGLSIFGLTLPFPAPLFMYRTVFSFLLIGLWAKWAALILALVSTAGMFPELIASGSIDLYLAKPISRLRLFLIKYATGLLFAMLQVSVFAVGSYLMFGLRIHEWRPSLFLIIPLVGLLYSYLFCFCALIGILTRSTIAAILLTVAFWFICFGINFAETSLFAVRTVEVAEARSAARQAREADAELRGLKDHPSITNFLGLREQRIRARRDRAAATAADAQKAADKVSVFHRIAYGVASVIPKTGETVSLLDRKLFSGDELAGFARQSDNGKSPFGGPMRGVDDEQDSPVPTTNPAEAAAQAQEDARDREDRLEMSRQTQEEASRAERSRSIPWIIGTSLGFEAVIVAWAAWIFCRRDY